MESINIQKLIDRANSGDVKAQELVGTAYYRGNGVEKDTGTAYQYLNMAAVQNSAMAICHIARGIETGEVGEPDVNRAIKYYDKAAKLGSLNARNKSVLLKDRLAKEQQLIANSGNADIDSQSLSYYKSVIEHQSGRVRKRLTALILCGLVSGIVMNLYIGYYRRAVVESLLFASLVGIPIAVWMMVVDFHRIWRHQIPCDGEGNEIQ